MEGKPEVFRMLRARTVIYASLILVVSGVMLYALLTRSVLNVNVLHDRNPLAVRLSGREPNRSAACGVRPLRSKI